MFYGLTFKDQAVKARWLHALRMGNFLQTRSGSLYQVRWAMEVAHTGGAGSQKFVFCCLGVFGVINGGKITIDVAASGATDTSLQIERDGGTKYPWQTQGYLPDPWLAEFFDWSAPDAGETPGGETLDTKERAVFYLQRHLARMNDEGEYDFPAIAEWVQTNL